MERRRKEGALRLGYTMNISFRNTSEIFRCLIKGYFH